MPAVRRNEALAEKVFVKSFLKQDVKQRSKRSSLKFWDIEGM